MRRFLLIAVYLTLPFSIAACSNADEELRAAEAAFEEKMFDEAIDFWTQAMASELLTRQQSAETHARRGIAYALIGKCDDAAADAKWAVNSDLLSSDQLALMHYHQAQCLFDSGDFKKALPLLENTLKATPNNTDAMVRKAAIHTSLREYEKAYDLHKRYIALHPESADAHNNLGSAALMMGYNQEADFHLNKAVELAPEKVHFRATRAGLFVKLGQYDLARDELNAALEQAADHPAAFEMYLTRGKIHAFQSRYDDALSDYDRSLALKPDYAAAQQAKDTLIALLEIRDEHN